MIICIEEECRPLRLKGTKKMEEKGIFKKKRNYKSKGKELVFKRTVSARLVKPWRYVDA